MYEARKKVRQAKSGLNCSCYHSVVNIVLSLSAVYIFETPWTTAYQGPLSFTNSQSLLKFISIKSVMLSNHLIFCHPHLLLPSIFPSIRVFFNESTLRIRWPKVLELQLQHQSFQWLFRVDFLWDWLVWGPRMSKGLSRVFSSTTIQKHYFFSK